MPAMPRSKKDTKKNSHRNQLRPCWHSTELSTENNIEQTAKNKNNTYNMVLFLCAHCAEPNENHYSTDASRWHTWAWHNIGHVCVCVCVVVMELVEAPSRPTEEESQANRAHKKLPRMSNGCLTVWLQFPIKKASIWPAYEPPHTSISNA